jgi:DNA-binding response OmpR family regulator
MTVAQAAVLLYVEDQILIQETVVLDLQDAGYEVLVANSGKEALEQLDSSFGFIRGLVTDVNLGPGLDGWSIARRARELIPGLPVVYVTGKGEHEWTSKGVPHSVVIGKPFDPTQVVVAISHLLDMTDAVGSLQSR